MTGAPMGKKRMTDQCKGTKRLRGHHKGQDWACVEDSGCTPFSHEVECLYQTCRHFISARQQVVETQSLPVSQLPLLQWEQPWSPWRLPARLSVSPGMVSPVMWPGKPLKNDRSGFSTTVTSWPVTVQEDLHGSARTCNSQILHVLSRTS